MLPTLTPLQSLAFSIHTVGFCYLPKYPIYLTASQNFSVSHSRFRRYFFRILVLVTLLEGIFCGILVAYFSLIETNHPDFDWIKRSVLFITFLSFTFFAGMACSVLTILQKLISVLNGLSQLDNQLCQAGKQFKCSKIRLFKYSAFHL